MKRPGLLLCLTTSLLLASCRGSESQASQSAEAPKAAQAPERPSVTARGHEADDAARFLAGLPGRELSPYKPVESAKAWIDHARTMDEMWSIYDKRRKPGMQKFQSSELVGPPVEGSVVWYPFSGADALTMLTFFPGHQTYVMAALEPPGMVPKPEEFESADLAKKLPAISGTLASLLSKSFFVTKEMDSQLRGQVTDGVTQPILILLARLGYTILGHAYVQLDEQGRIVKREEDSQRAAFGKNRAIVFEVQRKGEGVETIYYISLNLADAHLKDNKAFQTYIAALGPTSTLLKSTSYMMHDKLFSLIRGMVLDRSGLIVQDDSGVPWKYFTPDKWNVQLYGDYEKPYGKDFDFRTQTDLRDAYVAQRDKVKPLEFRMGYGAGKVTSNIQVARRK